MFGKLLIANRGEIACRVIRTAQKMGIPTVAVFSEADAYALHTQLASEAVLIGPAPARSSYLRIDRIIAAAKQTGADAIHPGYGFLSENPLFAEACEQAGIVFVGPPASAMRAMGSKAEAKRLMQDAGVPLVPGYHGVDQSDALLAGKAAMIGFPVMIKASAGGGGRGMRAVGRAEDFLAALAAARREAEAAFGDGRVLVEKCLQRPRHIEVQVLADTHGNILQLGTRDCSIQRRHQKIIEEAPAPGLSEATRNALGAAAIAAAKACNYVNAGTVEFIAEGSSDDPDFYFMEMNTRLQVEHPVTEAVCDIDLVELQLRIAAGESLADLQPDLRARGHAIEARLCAEDPEHDFRPSTGRIEDLFLPESSRVLRFDFGFQSGDIVTSHYDSLLAKVIAFGATREEARLRLADVLRFARIAQPVTNLTLLRRIVAHEAFAQAELDTDFLARHAAALLPPRQPPPAAAWAAAALHRAHQQLDPDAQPWVSDPEDPWVTLKGFRIAGSSGIRIALRAGETRHELVVHAGNRECSVRLPDSESVARSRPRRGSIMVDGLRVLAKQTESSGEIQVALGGDPELHRFQVIDLYAPPGADTSGPDRIAAPIPGTILRVDVAAGDVVARGKVLVVMEAMKTEIRIAAPADGTVARVLVKPGDMVQEGMELVQLTHDDAKPGA